jgi:ribosomal protein S19
MINIGIEVPSLDDIRYKLGTFEHKAPDLLKNAINRTAKDVGSNMAKQASKDYLVTPRGVKKTISIKNSTKIRLSATVTTEDSPIPIINFDIKPRKGPIRISDDGKRDPKIYKARVRRDTSAKGVERMFVVKKQVLVRPEGATRAENNNPRNWIRFSLSVPQMIGTKENINEIRIAAINKLSERVNHEVQYELSKGVMY